MKTAIALLSASAVLVGLAGTAAAQQPADPVVTLKLPRSTVQQIGNALMEMPYKSSAPILLELQRQLSEANQASRPAEPTPEPAPSPSPPPAPPQKQ